MMWLESAMPAWVCCPRVPNEVVLVTAAGRAYTAPAGAAERERAIGVAARMLNTMSLLSLRVRRRISLDLPPPGESLRETRSGRRPASGTFPAA